MGELATREEEMNMGGDAGEACCIVLVYDFYDTFFLLFFILSCVLFFCLNLNVLCFVFDTFFLLSLSIKIKKMS